MKRLIVIISGLFVAAGLAAVLMLWHDSDVHVFNGHVMGESNLDFVKIEAKLNNINLDKCDDIGRTKKRQLCDDLLELKNGRRDFIKLTNAEARFKGKLTGAGAKGDLTNARLENARLFQLLVSAGSYDPALGELTAKYGPPHRTGEHKVSRFESRGTRVSVWFVKPHTVIALEEDTVTYSYVDNPP